MCYDTNSLQVICKSYLLASLQKQKYTSLSDFWSWFSDWLSEIALWLAKKPIALIWLTENAIKLESICNLPEQDCQHSRRQYYLKKSENHKKFTGCYVTWIHEVEHGKNIQRSICWWVYRNYVTIAINCFKSCIIH